MLGRWHLNLRPAGPSAISRSQGNVMRTNTGSGDMIQVQCASTQLHRRGAICSAYFHLCDCSLDSQFPVNSVLVVQVNVVNFQPLQRCLTSFMHILGRAVYNHGPIWLHFIAKFGRNDIFLPIAFIGFSCK